MKALCRQRKCLARTAERLCEPSEHDEVVRKPAAARQKCALATRQAVLGGDGSNGVWFDISSYNPTIVDNYELPSGR